MQRKVATIISLNLYKELKREKERLKKKQLRKRNTRKKKITLYEASESLYRKVIR